MSHQIAFIDTGLGEGEGAGRGLTEASFYSTYQSICKSKSKIIAKCLDNRQINSSLTHTRSEGRREYCECVCACPCHIWQGDPSDKGSERSSSARQNMTFITLY